MAVANTASLSIRLLGELEVRHDGTPVALPPSRRTRALLAYLVEGAHPASRAALCDLLWEGPDDPRGALRWSLAKLRPVLDHGTRRLRADREHVGFDHVQCDVDTDRLPGLLAGPSLHAPLAVLEEAALLLQGEFLGGLDLPSCYRFHQWCVARREHYATLRRQVHGALLERLQSQPDEALRYARAMATADPLCEEAHACVVRLLAAAGRYPEAERHYEWARDLLRREVSMPAGGPLDKAILGARRRLREPAPDPAQAQRPTAAQAPCPAPGLVGRATQREMIDSTLQLRDRPAALLFVGEPGIGKTSLLEYAAARAGQLGHAVVRARCFQAEMIRPYGVWIDALRAIESSGLPGPALEGAAPLLRGATGASAAGREALFDAVVELVQAVAKVRPVTVLLDDLQWTDEASAALLHYLVRRLEDQPVAFLGAARTGEVDDNPFARAALQSLVRAGQLRQVRIEGLSTEEAAALLRAWAPGTAHQDLLRRAGGNPLYLLELSRAALRGHAEGDPTLDALIEQRLAALDDAGRDLLGWAAALGRELQAELLACATGLPVSTVLARLEHLLRLGLLVASGDGQFDFAHDLVRDGVYRALSQPRRRSIHGQLARALHAASATDPRLHGEIVRHAALAGDPWMTASACVAAGEHCLSVCAYRDALTVADQGLARLEQLPHGPQRVTLEVSLLRLSVFAQTGPRSVVVPAMAERLKQAVAAAESLGLYAQAAIGWEALSMCQQQASDTAAAQHATLCAERATQYVDAATHCRQLANSGRCLIDIEADVARGRTLLAQAQALAGELHLQVMELEWGLALLARHHGDLDGAARGMERAIMLARAARNHWREYECMVWAATIEWERGDDAGVTSRSAAIRELTERMGDTEAPFPQALAALARWRCGDDAGAEALHAALASLRALDDKAHLAYALNEGAALALCAGDTHQAAAFAREALTAAQAVRRPTEVCVAQARLALCGLLPEGGPQEPAPSARAATALAQARAHARLAAKEERHGTHRGRTQLRHATDRRDHAGRR